MPSSICRLLLPGLLAVLPVVAAAQSGVRESQDALREAAAARRDGDGARLVAALEAARDLNPASLYTRYNLARAYAQAGNADAALGLLEGLVRQRVDFGIADETEFRPLHDLPRFRALSAAAAERTAPVSRSTLYHEIPRIDLVAEGIAFDAGGKRLFVGSMRSGEVFVIDRNGYLAKFAEVAQDGPLAAIGMTVDPARGLLWVVGASFFLAEGHDAGAPVVSGVFGFDLASGSERWRFLRDDAGHGYNDVTLAPDGTLYLSGAELGRLSPGDGATIETLATSEPVFGSNGIFVTPDGALLVTSAYPAGIAVVRLADGATRFMTAPPELTLYGIDGMYLHDGDIVAVQNGPQPWRLMRYTVDAAFTAVTAARAVEFGNPAVATTAAIDGDRIHYLAQRPAVAEPPAHLDSALHPYLGSTVILTAPLD